MTVPRSLFFGSTSGNINHLNCSLTCFLREYEKIGSHLQTMQIPAGTKPTWPESDLFALIGVFAIVGCVITRLFTKAARARRYPLPPGPPGELLLGHYRVVPDDAPFLKYAQWAREYSMMSSSLSTSTPSRGLLANNGIRPRF